MGVALPKLEQVRNKWRLICDEEILFPYIFTKQYLYEACQHDCTFLPANRNALQMWKTLFKVWAFFTSIKGNVVIWDQTRGQIFLTQTIEELTPTKLYLNICSLRLNCWSCWWHNDVASIAHRKVTEGYFIDYNRINYLWNFCCRMWLWTFTDVWCSSSQSRCWLRNLRTKLSREQRMSCVCAGSWFTDSWRLASIKLISSHF